MQTALLASGAGRQPALLLACRARAQWAKDRARRPYEARRSRVFGAFLQQCFQLRGFFPGRGGVHGFLPSSPQPQLSPHCWGRFQVLWLPLPRACWPFQRTTCKPLGEEAGGLVLRLLEQRLFVIIVPRADAESDARSCARLGCAQRRWRESEGGRASARLRTATRSSSVCVCVCVC